MSEFPCDGGCNVNDGPSEECSAHGRPPAQIWEIVAEVSKQRDAALARIARVQAVVEQQKHWNEDCWWDVPSGAILRALTDDPVS